MVLFHHQLGISLYIQIHPEKVVGPRKHIKKTPNQTSGVFAWISRYIVFLVETDYRCVFPDIFELFRRQMSGYSVQADLFTFNSLISAFVQQQFLD